jgi:hypothetical protein
MGSRTLKCHYYIKGFTVKQLIMIISQPWKTYTYSNNDISATHNIMYVCQVLARLKLQCMLVCYSSSIQVNQFIPWCMDMQWLVSMQQRVGGFSSCKAWYLISSRLWKFKQIINSFIQIVLTMMKILSILHNFHMSMIITPKNKYCHTSTKP